MTQPNVWTPAQRDVAYQILAEADAQHATATQEQAMIEAAIVEDSLRNSTVSTDQDSLGVFQMRPSQGWGTPAQVTNIKYEVDTWLAHAQQYSSEQDASVLAQDVERSAFPDRYGQHYQDAINLVNDWRAGGHITSTNVDQTSTTTGLTSQAKSLGSRAGVIIGGGALMLVGVWVLFRQELPGAIPV